MRGALVAFIRGECHLHELSGLSEKRPELGGEMFTGLLAAVKIFLDFG